MGLDRSPPRISSQANVNDAEKPLAPIFNKKRKADDDNNHFSLILEAMEKNKHEVLNAMNAKVSEQMVELRGVIETKSASQMQKLDELRNDIGTTFDGLNSRVSSIESSLGSTSKSVDQLQCKMNDLEQSNFATHMDIVGIETSTVDNNKNDLKAFVGQLFTSFAISIEAHLITHAFIRPISNDRRVITVIFASIDAKTNVMKLKRGSKDVRKIFFDHRLTPTNRRLLFDARDAVRSKKAKSAFVASGRVMLECLDGSKRRICSKYDIDELPVGVAPAQSSTSIETTTPSTSADKHA